MLFISNRLHKDGMYKKRSTQKSPLSHTHSCSRGDFIEKKFFPFFFNNINNSLSSPRNRLADADMLDKLRELACLR